jgi:rRNA maturation endonuclease Nob1
MVLSAAVVLVVGTLLFTLFVRSQDVPEAPAVSPTAHLEERKAQIYENLRDLQFEFRLGKLSDADYQKTKVDLQRELARVLADIDAVQPAATMQPAKAKAAKAAAETIVKVSDQCPHCGAKFPQPLKFCGECGKAMA